MAVAADEQLLEREDELAALDDLLERARDGDGRVVLIEGAAGIGKTRLVQAAGEHAKEAGVQVLTARGTELEREFPFALVRQLFEPVMRALEPGERDKLLAEAARPAATVVGLEADDQQTETEEPAVDPSFAMLNALYWLTSNLAESAPLLLAVDDAHWTDKASTRFFRFLSPRIQDLPVLLALAARPSEPGADSELLDQFAGDEAAQFLRPRTLSPRAVAEFVRSQLSSAAEHEFCAASHTATGGNPFLLHELVTELSAQGSAGTAGEANEVRQLAPATIQRSVLLRIARLPDEAGRLASAVAILGDNADRVEAGALAELDADTAAGATDALVAADILESRRPLRFAHPLVRNAVYADIPSADKDQAHRKAGQILRNRSEEPERIALHLLATDPAGDAEAVETLESAADRALERAAPEAALSYVRRALAEPPDPRRRPAVLRKLVPAWFRSMQGDASVELLEPNLVEELTADPALLLDSAVELATGLFMRGHLADSIEVLEAAISAAVDAGDHGLATRFEAFMFFATRMPPSEARARLGRYEASIEPGTPGRRVWLAMAALLSHFTGEPRATVAQLARDALEDGRIWTEESENLLPSSATVALLESDELEEAERAIERNLSIARARGGAGEIAGATYTRAQLALLRGEIADAEADARATVEAARQGGLLSVWPNWLALLIEILVERDDLSAAEAELASVGMTGVMPDNWWYAPLRLSRARLRLGQAKADQAVQDFIRLAESLERAGVKIRSGLAGSYRARALAALGEVEEALQGAEQEVADARDWGAPRRLGFALGTLGLIKGDEDGIELQQEALAVLEPSAAKLEYAHTLADYGGTLRRAGRRAEAREPLRSALSWARRFSAMAIAHEAHAELEATGEKLGPLVGFGVEALTPSERRICALAADGLTNRQIAQQLFLSIKTVESHLRGAYRKLDISSRGELGAALKTSSESS